MDGTEAAAPLRHPLERCRARSHRELRSPIAAAQAVERVGPSGTRFRIEIFAVWDDQVGGDLRVIGAIDDAAGGRSCR